MSKIGPYIEVGSPTCCRMKRARNRSTTWRHVGFTPDCGRIAATQRTDATGHIWTPEKQNPGTSPGLWM